MADHHSGPEPDRLDRYLRVLADPERRKLLAHLRAIPDSTVTVEDLVQVLVTHSGANREQARIRLHHTHLPRLADTPSIEYDAHSATVRYRAHDDLDTLLTVIRRIETGDGATD